MYPFIEGRNGYQAVLSDQQWSDFGKALKRIHSAVLPDNLKQLLLRETFPAKWRDLVVAFLKKVELEEWDEQVARKTAGLLRTKSADIIDLIVSAERLAQRLRSKSLEYVLCHSDLHAGNLLVAVTGGFFIVDWDNPIYAPKERDLMYFGGGQGFPGHSPEEEQSLFYRGYGTTGIDQGGLAYYRLERIIEDIAAYCESLLLKTDGGADREQSYTWLASNFLPGNTIEIARAAEKASLGFQALC